MTKTKKVYDYNQNQVKSKLVTAFKKRGRESTIADLISLTGLPKYQVQETVRDVADEYQGHMRVSDSGEILYYFPAGMRSREKGFSARARRFLRRFLSVAGKVLAALFKVWIVVMLVGYFLLFVAILIAAILASVAGTAASRGRSSRGGGIFGFYLAMRAFQIFTWVWLTSGTGSYRQKGYRDRGRRLHKSAFAYVFGEQGVNRRWEEKQKAHILSFIRGSKGVLTLDELRTMTGLEEEEAQQLLNRLLVEWEGEPMVTDEGSLIFFFPELLKSRPEELRQASREPLMMKEKKRLIPFNDNPKRTNRWLTFFNGFNFLFSAYFLNFALANPEPVIRTIRRGGELVQRMEMDFAFVYHYVHRFLASANVQSPESVIFVGLGVIPLAFAVLFFLIPWLRRRREKRQNQAIQEENLRRKLYFQVLGSPDSVDPDDIQPSSIEESPKRWRQFLRKALDRLAALRAGEIEQKEKGKLVYRFPEIERELKDVEEYRNQVDLGEYQVGETIFDTGSSESSP